ncbi:MAG: hypothetical protein AB7V16_07205 [Vulcanibacillus sp.]
MKIKFTHKDPKYSDFLFYKKEMSYIPFIGSIVRFGRTEFKVKNVVFEVDEEYNDIEIELCDIQESYEKHY